MERRKRSERGVARSRIAGADRPPLANIAELISHGGQITVGALRPVQCAAVANDEHSCLAMLRRKPAETLPQLLERLDAAIGHAWSTEQFIDEINIGPRR